MVLRHLDTSYGAYLYNTINYNGITCVGYSGAKYVSYEDDDINVTGSYTDADKSVNLWIKNVKRCL
jgi:hypothetical protein